MAIQTQTYEEAFATWLIGAQKILDEYWKRSKFTMTVPKLTATHGTRYTKVLRVDESSKSVHAFIDRTGGKIKGITHKAGDVLKPATYQTPAVHPRGNIFDDSNGLKYMNEYGPAYLR